MIAYENNCVSCERCVNCGKNHEEVTVCDVCREPFERKKNGTAKKYSRIGYGSEELCETCAAKYADKIFNGYLLSDQLELFDWEKEDFATETGAAVAVSEAWYELSDEDKCERMVETGEFEEGYL